ncbi:hypothetical protein D3C73_598330 [compost metagenome]
MSQLYLTPRQVQQYKVGHQVEQQHPDFVDRYAQVVDDIEMFHRKREPAIVQSIHTIVSEHKDGKPADDDQVVDGEVPEQECLEQL